MLSAVLSHELSLDAAITQSFSRRTGLTRFIDRGKWDTTTAPLDTSKVFEVLVS